MRVVEHLYSTPSHLAEMLVELDPNRPCSVQIFTHSLQPNDAVQLAKELQSLLPLAQVVGCSTSGIIYQGSSMDNETLIVVHQYDRSNISSHLVEITSDVDTLADDISKLAQPANPNLIRLFVGGLYNHAQQLIEQLNQCLPTTKFVGGMAGELFDQPPTPFVFTPDGSFENAVVLTTVSGEHNHIYSRINSSHETVGPVYTVTGVDELNLTSIENVPALEWMERNLGKLDATQYETWEEIAANDPLVRLQLAFEDHDRTIRFVRFDKPTNQITQYFSRLKEGTRFRISYTSPAKCVKECEETCQQVVSTPIEHLFAYSCLFRKLYMSNCAQWELTPYHQKPVSGVLLLGEFGHSDMGNSLLNGSCVLSGISEYDDRFLPVDFNALKTLDGVHSEDTGLMDFIIRRQSNIVSHENERLLSGMIAHESEHGSHPLQSYDFGFEIGDTAKYEQDKDRLQLNKLCMVRVENADVLVSHWGQEGYYSHVKGIIASFDEERKRDNLMANIHVYMIRSDTMLVASNKAMKPTDFLSYVRGLNRRCSEAQSDISDLPFLLRFIIIRGKKFLLERAYALLEESRNSQNAIVGEEVLLDTTDSFKTSISTATTETELESLQNIQYALKHSKVVPYYQGLHNNRTNQIDKYESLMRLVDPSGKVLTPFFFMDVAKKYRYYLDLNLVMFQQVIRDFSNIDAPVNINISAHDITSPRFRQELTRVLKTFHKPENLTFEILEDECFSDMQWLTDFITEVRKFGAKIAVDDFGAGYSNLLEIMKIHPDYIKIDGQIIRELGVNHENNTIVEAVASIGQKLEIDIVAEFVEDETIQNKLMEYNILYSQGYHFAKPEPFHSILQHLSQG